MKRLPALLFFILCSCLMARAQDIVTLKDGTRIEAKVLEVNIDNIRYKKISNPDGPIYTEAKWNISSITYENGYTETYQVPYPRAIMARPGRKKPEGIRPGMKYKDYIGLYDKNDYTGFEREKVSPFVAGACSYMIPGLGQALCGEWLRGLCIDASIVGCIACTAGLAEISGDCSALFGLTAAALWVWNVFDAVKVCKIKNMYLNDVKLDPYVSSIPSSADGRLQASAGLSLKLNF